MRKKIVCLLIIGMLFLLTGCEKESEFKEIDVLLESGKISSTCTKEEPGEELKKTIVITTNYNSNEDAINVKTQTKYVFDDSEQYELYVDATKINEEYYKDLENVTFKYSLDPDNKIIKTTLAYTKLNIDEEIKEQYTVSKTVIDSEKLGYTCVISGITRDNIKIDD